MIQIPQLQKELTSRRVALALQVEIPDIAAYALEWSKLAADFERAGWKANAAICRSNAERYGAMDMGADQRLLQEIPAHLEKNQNAKECATCQTFTTHVQLNSPDGEMLGWMCGCGTFVPATDIEKEYYKMQYAEVQHD